MLVSSVPWRLDGGEERVRSTPTPSASTAVAVDAVVLGELQRRGWRSSGSCRAASAPVDGAALGVDEGDRGQRAAGGATTLTGASGRTSVEALAGLEGRSSAVETAGASRRRPPGRPASGARGLAAADQQQAARLSSATTAACQRAARRAARVPQRSCRPEPPTTRPPCATSCNALVTRKTSSSLTGCTAVRPLGARRPVR